MSNNKCDNLQIIKICALTKSLHSFQNSLNKIRFKKTKNIFLFYCFMFKLRYSNMDIC